MLTLLRLVVDQPLAPAVRCSGCQQKFTRLPASGLCPGCDLVNVARAIVGLPPKKCCSLEVACVCGGAFCTTHGQRCTGRSHD